MKSIDRRLRSWAYMNTIQVSLSLWLIHVLKSRLSQDFLKQTSSSTNKHQLFMLGSSFLLLSASILEGCTKHSPLNLTKQIYNTPLSFLNLDWARLCKIELEQPSGQALVASKDESFWGMRFCSAQNKELKQLTEVEEPHANSPTLAVPGIFNTIPFEDLNALEEFFRVFLKTSQGGYVLYGNKPVCVEAFPYREEGTVFLAKNAHRFCTKLKNGALIWKKLKLNNFFNNYILCIGEHPCFEKWVSCTLINKEKFINTVRENLPLFQYILGPKITPESLLAKITQSDESFHCILENNRVLIGILLGYGTQNAILGSRKELISETAMHPSFGFNSIAEELAWLENKEKLSTSFSNETAPSLPWFCCYEEKETEILINAYKEARKKIEKTLKSENFLQNVLDQFFNVKVILQADRFSNSAFSENNQLTKIVAQSIWCCIDAKERNPKYIHHFRQGMNASEKGTNPLPEDEYRDLVALASSTEKTDLRNQLAYHAGVLVWDHFKKGSDFYSFSEINNFLDEIAKNSALFSHIDANDDAILTRLHAHIYAKEPEELVLGR